MLMLRITALLLFPFVVYATDSALRLSNASVGRGLERAATVSLEDGAPDEGVEVTIKSSDPSRLLVSSRPDQPGAPTIKLKIRQGYKDSPEFWLQGLDGSGEVQYTAEASHYASASAAVKITPAGILILGPMKAPRFITTTGAGPTRVTIVSARLDDSLGNAEEQPVSGAIPASLELISSRPEIGRVDTPRVTIPAGSSYVATTFQPAGEGETLLSVAAPSAFSTAALHASVRAIVQRPRLGLSDQLRIGENLEVSGVLLLGEAAPATGLDVTIMSEDPARLLLSTSAETAGAASIGVHVPPFGGNARYYLQALDRSGTISYTASAHGYSSRTAMVTLTPSGVVLTPATQGPPDEAQVLRQEAPDGTHRFSVSLKKPERIFLVAWTAQLDPITHRSADITVQPLRAGVSLNVDLRNSNPGVGEVADRLTIPAASDHCAAEFTVRGAGSTEITILTPKKFTESANSTKVIGFVLN